MTEGRANPKTKNIFDLALRLRAKNAQLHEVMLAAVKACPVESPSNRSMRSVIKRLVLVPPGAFARATRAYEAGKNIHEIVKLVPTITASGASVGNTHGTGNRRKPVLPQLNTLWKVASEVEKRAFLREHELTRLRGR